MSQVLLSLNSVTSDTDGDVLQFDAPQTNYGMHYIATIPSGSAIVAFEGSLDGVNFFTVGSATLGNNANDVIVGGPPALYIRARASGLSAGRTVTALVAVVL